MTDITDRLRSWCYTPTSGTAQDLMDEAAVAIERLRDALDGTLDHRDLLTVKVSQWEAVTKPRPIEISAEVSLHPKSDRIYVSGQDSDD